MSLTLFHYAAGHVLPILAGAVLLIFVLSLYVRISFPAWAGCACLACLLLLTPVARLALEGAFAPPLLYGLLAALLTAAAAGTRLFPPPGPALGMKALSPPGGAAGEKAAYFTFDDGPSPAWTPQVLHVLKEEGINAIFFVVGEEVRRHPHLVQAIIDAGMEVGVHSHSHKILPLLFATSLDREMDACMSALKDAGCPAPRLFRPPCGIYNRQVMDAALSRGLTPLLWNCSSGDWMGLSPAAIRQNSLKGRENPCVLLFHDGQRSVVGRKSTVEALPGVIRGLREMGYQFPDPAEILAKGDSCGIAHPCERKNGGGGKM
jgi:peptidoglycan/xylan/chitin deacetylase (PgdA/CDA1 family)